MGEVRPLFSDDELRPNKPPPKQSQEIQDEWAIVDRVIKCYEDYYIENTRSNFVPKPRLRLKEHQKKRFRDMVRMYPLLTCFMFVHRFWAKDGDGKYETVTWSGPLRKSGAFLSNAAWEDLENDWKIKQANLSRAREFFAHYLEGLDDGEIGI